MPDEAPKIIVDTDWKSQARAEKERLAAKAAPAPGKPAPAAPGATPAPAMTVGGGAAVPASSAQAAGAVPTEADAGAEGEAGKEGAGFQDLVSVLVSQALMYMGAFPDPRTGQAIVAPEYARVYIDLLGVLEDKTKGNLTPDEAALLSKTAAELRLEYVDIVRAVDRAVAEGRIKPRGGAGGPGGGMGIVTAPAQPQPPR
jgi:hypothetical protein